MEIIEKFNLKTKALVIILITVLLACVSTMSFAAEAETTKRFAFFEGIREKLEVRMQEAREYLKEIREHSEIKFEGNKLKVLISDGEKGRINVDGSIGLEDGCLVAEADGDFKIVIERDGKEIELVGTTVNGEITLDMQNKEVMALVEEGELRLVDGTIELGAVGAAGAILDMTDNGITINGAADGVVTAEVKDNEILRIEGTVDEEGNPENNATITVGKDGIDANVNAGQRVTLLKDKIKMQLKERLGLKVNREGAEATAGGDLEVNEKPIVSGDATISTDYVNNPNVNLSGAVMGNEMPDRNFEIPVKELISRVRNMLNR